MYVGKMPLKGEKCGYVIEERHRDAQMMCVLDREKTSVTLYSAVFEHTRVCSVLINLVLTVLNISLCSMNRKKVSSKTSLLEAL